MEEINVKDFRSKKPTKRDYQSIFWKDRYNNRADDTTKENLNKILGYNQDLWMFLNKQELDWNSIKVEKINSKFENEKPGYIGKFSGDLIVNYKGSVKIGGKIYFNTWTIFIDTTRFW